MDKLVLANIQALAASPDYAGRGFLQSSSAVLALSAALFLSDLTLWQGAGYKLTDGEIDNIQAMIAQLEEDLMLTGELYAMDRVKVTTTALLSVPDDTEVFVDWDAEIYDPEGMHSTTVSPHYIDVLRTGLHIIEANIVWNSSSVGYRKLRLLKRVAATGLTVPVTRVFDSVSSAGWIETQILYAQDYAEEGDRYTIGVRQTSGAALSLLKDTFSPTFSVFRP